MVIRLFRISLLLPSDHELQPEEMFVFFTDSDYHTIHTLVRHDIAGTLLKSVLKTNQPINHTFVKGCTDAPLDCIPQLIHSSDYVMLRV